MASWTKNNATDQFGNTYTAYGNEGYSNLQNTLATNNANYQIAQMNNQTQMDIANANNLYNYQMWQRQNSYNSPSAQMDRLREAGLNPNLAYGSLSEGNAGQVAPAESVSLHQAQMQQPGYQSNTQKLADLLSLMNTLQDQSMKRAQIRQIDANTESIKSDNVLKALDADFWSNEDGKANRHQYLRNQLNLQQADVKYKEGFSNFWDNYGWELLKGDMTATANQKAVSAARILVQQEMDLLRKDYMLEHHAEMPSDDKRYNALTEIMQGLTSGNGQVSGDSLMKLIAYMFSGL